MILPSKVVSVDESALSLSAAILEKLSVPHSLSDLYIGVGMKPETTQAFLLAIDLLWLLEKIEVNFKEGVIYRAN